jgi:hypothetical protein
MKKIKNKISSELVSGSRDHMRDGTANGRQGFLFGQTEDSLRHYLEERLNRPVLLVLTENATSILSARMHDGVLRVRLHRMFLNAGRRVTSEIASYLKNRRGAMPHFRSFIRDNKEQLSLKPPKKISVRTAGKFHDLSELYREINEEYFGGTVDAAITWGPGSSHRAVRKRTLGSYSERSRTIRINPVLDKKTVPRYYVAFVVYHEMLHAAVGMPLRGKRRSIHSGEFRKREGFFRDYGLAVAWERGKA